MRLGLGWAKSRMVYDYKQFFGIHASNNGRVMIFAGGIPLKRGGQIVGAIGVSGGSGEQDQTVAEAGTAAFE
jgi:uncharacterized protein GlcG (DUF336 family)